MARNDRLGTGWSQPRRSATAKSHTGCVGGQGTGDLDDLGDIMSLLSGCNKNKNNSKDSWHVHHGNPSSKHFSPRDCCLKNGRIHCSCLWSKNDFSVDNQNNRRNLGNSVRTNESLLSYERKTPFWHENTTASPPVGNKMAEEYVLDDNELCFDFYDIPFNMPKRHHIRKVGKVKTVSIIDTLSELASGATDREDEGGFSSAVSESALLSNDFYKSRVKQGRHATSRRGRVTRENCFPSAPVTTKFPTKSDNRYQVNNDLNVCHDSIFGSQFKDINSDDGNFTCSSLKRTLKYLRKAVSSNVVEEEPRIRRHVRRHEEKDILRQCFSDSEVREVPKPWAPSRREKPETSFRSKSRSFLTVTPQNAIETPTPKYNEKAVITSHIRLKAEAPDWIKTVFSAAKKGDVGRLKEGLKDIDSALVRNLSDDHGNNLWHICAAQNNIQCLDWLCARNTEQTEALKDENKHGFTPIALAVKHGSLLAVQWLIHTTISKSQLSGTGNSRSLLHIAAKYGQETVVQWLLSYMNSQDMNVNCLDSEGNTALHLAAKHGKINCVKILIFQNGNIKARNERGLKPLNLAVKYSQVNCADYLLAMESCYNLATVHLKQQSELQQLHKENIELRNHFKELLTLTKRLQHRQRELVQTFTQTDQSGQYDSDVNERNVEKRAKYVDEYSQLLAAVIADEEHRLMLVEDRWNKSRKQSKLMDSKKGPLDIIRSQFTHILDKVNDQSPAVPSTPETSDDSWQSGDEDTSSSLPLGGSAANICSSTPDVIHTLPNLHVPFDIKCKQQQNERPVDFSKKQKDFLFENISYNSSSKLPKEQLDIKSSAIKSVPGSARDVNLQVFFKQNPNLRQTSETCSVLEVLEPSSSDSDDCANKKRCSSKDVNTEEELIQSSSSSAAETLSPSCGPSSSGSKKSGSRSSSNGSRHNTGGGRSGNVPNIYSMGNESKSSAETVEKKEAETINNSNNVDSLNCDTSLINNFDNNCFAEPDLLRGTQRKKRIELNERLSSDEHKKEKELNDKDMHAVDNPSISTEDSESLEADRSFCSAIDAPESLLVSQMLPDPSVTGTGVKKKSFLLKFALRGKWPSKHRPRSSKNEISPEEFRETYSRSSENVLLPSQCPATGISVTKKLPSPPSKDSEKIQEQISVIDSSNCIGRNLDNSSVFSTPCGDMSRPSLQHSPLGLLPPRRDPPPIPPRPLRDESSQIPSDANIRIGILTSSSCITESAISLHDPYISTSSSNLWQSPDSKSLFRPASSASRVESPSRADESFPLNKSSSVSTEILSALDSSTAGRQSPAPSEVSKTESALSPPSDVSKTESTRYLSQLGRIEESSHLAVIKAAAIQNSTTDPNIDNHQDRNQEKIEIKPKKKSSSSKKNNPDKPWYEFSDEEDLITPQRYEVMSGRMRSSSEDEEVVTN